MVVASLPPATVRPVSDSAVTDGKPREPLSYTVPTAVSDAPAAMPAARLTSYVFAHSKYSSVLGQSNVLSGLLTDAEDQEPVAAEKASASGDDVDVGRLPKGAHDGSP